VTKKIPGLGSLFSIIFAVLILNTCDLFQESLVEYLREEPDQEMAEDDGPWVYVNVNLPDDTNNSGWSKTEPVKTLGRALDIWAGSVPPGEPVEAKIMLLEDIIDDYGEPGATMAEVINFATLLGSRSDIAAFTLAGSGGGKTIANETGSNRKILYINNPGQTITLKNLTITGGKARGILVEKGDLVIANGVIIKNNTATSGGGVWLGNDGAPSLTMTGGEICFNIATDTNFGGGGVYVGNGAVFTLKAGTIRNNTSDSEGGGVSTRGSGTIIMEGGTIRNNTAATAGGGVYVGGSSGTSSFTLKGGTISGNEATNPPTGKGGGGVCVAANGIFTMEGGTVSGNISGNDGGGVYVSGSSTSQRGTACIRRGFIGVADGGNRAKYGGGVFVWNYGHLELGLSDGSGGPEIQHNVASGPPSPGSTGGGVVINGSEAQAYLYQGTISHNTTYRRGGGILVVNGTLEMQGGTITGNQVDASGAGPGLAVESGGRLRLSGLARVLHNDNPIFLLHGSDPKIILGTFTGDTSNGIAKIALASSGYVPGTTTILSGMDASLLGKFTIVDPSNRNIDSTGKLQ
jgi:hypothetical protein